MNLRAILPVFLVISVAAPGSVYVSEQTAALLSAGGHREFACDYLGNMTLAKSYGSSALYRLRRTAEED